MTWLLPTQTSWLTFWPGCSGTTTSYLLHTTYYLLPTTYHILPTT